MGAPDRQQPDDGARSRRAGQLKLQGSWLNAALALALASALRAPGCCEARPPHVLLVLADDLGYGNVGWTRSRNNCSTPEVQTSTMDRLVAEGIELTRFYAYHMCSPSRSSLMSGRLPMHVNVVNDDPTIYNASESTGTGAGIPRNMTGLASKLKSAGFATHMVGKWDAGSEFNLLLLVLAVLLNTAARRATF